MGDFEYFNCVYVVFDFVSGEFLYGIFFWRVQVFWGLGGVRGCVCVLCSFLGFSVVFGQFS